MGFNFYFFEIIFLQKIFFIVYYLKLFYYLISLVTLMSFQSSLFNFIDHTSQADGGKSIHSHPGAAAWMQQAALALNLKPHIVTSRDLSHS